MPGHYQYAQLPAPSYPGQTYQYAPSYPHPHHHHHHGDEVIERIDATSAIVLGVLSLVLFWPLCFCGLASARSMRHRIRGIPHHPDRGAIMAAYAINLASLIIGMVAIVVVSIVLTIILTSHQ